MIRAHQPSGVGRRLMGIVLLLSAVGALVLAAQAHDTPMPGMPDHDFAAMMIPHHQGAIDMAKVELLYGKDPVLRRLAQEIIVTQGSEIGVMQLQLKKHPGSPPAPQ